VSSKTDLSPAGRPAQNKELLVGLALKPDNSSNSRRTSLITPREFLSAAEKNQ
jgi:hypothetical protein